ncbi:uncharacterized protein C8orf34 homolog [Glandiceps talaboti]
MSAQHRVQAYLEKHHIGALFEDLMARLIQTTPEEPIPYLVKVLQRMDDKTKRPYQENPLATRTRPPSGVSSKKSVSVSRSYEDIPRRTKSAIDPMRKSTGGAAQWASTDPMGVRKGDKGAYEKPWTTNMRRTKPGQQTSTGGTHKVTIDESENTRPAGRKTKKAEWDHHTKMTTQSFDEMFETEQGTRTKGMKTSKIGWGDQDEDLLYSSSGYRGVQHQYQDDPLAGEIVIRKSRPRHDDDEGYSTSSSVARRHTKPDKKSQAHKKQLEEYIKSQNTGKRRILTGDEADDEDEDPDAIDLLENLDDLRSEGVTKLKSSGNKVSKSFRHASAEPQVRVSICARCAKIIGGQPSEYVHSEYSPNGGYGELKDYDDANSDYPSARHFAPIQTDDEEFESVSQVHSPRRPVWHDDTDTSTLGPTEGAHMYHHSRKSTFPMKGKPMYGRERSGYLPEDSDDNLNENDSKPLGPTSDVLEHSHGWTPQTYRSDTEDDDRVVKTDKMLYQKGRSWQTPMSDDDETYDFDGTRGGRSSKSQEYSSGGKW